MNTKSICVFCGASPGRAPIHMKMAEECGRQIAASEYRLVYGGGGIGLMGAVARAAHKDGGQVLGIIPKFLTEREQLLSGISHEIVPDMRSRKQRMLEESDGFIVLPGGIGTLEEAIEVLSWIRLDLHRKPMVFVGAQDYWFPLLELLSHITEQGFCPPNLLRRVFHAQSSAEAIAQLESDWKD